MDAFTSIECPSFRARRVYHHLPSLAFKTYFSPIRFDRGFDSFDHLSIVHSMGAACNRILISIKTTTEIEIYMILLH
jgi:hypothetical protein